MPYEVMIDDNFADMDETARYRAAVFTDADDALAYCRRIVDDFLASESAHGPRGDDLFDRYTTFGEDPFIRSIDAEPVPFSAWDYARERCAAVGGTGVGGRA